MTTQSDLTKIRAAVENYYSQAVADRLMKCLSADQERVRELEGILNCLNVCGDVGRAVEAL